MLDKKQYKWKFTMIIPEIMRPSVYYEDWLYTFYQAPGYVAPLNKKDGQFTKIITDPLIFDIYSTSISVWNNILSTCVPSKDSKSFKQEKIHINSYLKRNHFQMVYFIFLIFLFFFLFLFTRAKLLACT